MKSIAGVGRILGMVMLYEIEYIARFPCEQDFASYWRLVKPAKQSNAKNFGHSGKKRGNAHLRWAFGEAVVLMLMGNKPAQAVLQKLASCHGKGKALAILANSLGRAAYYMLKNQVPSDQERCLREAACREEADQPDCLIGDNYRERYVQQSKRSTYFWVRNPKRVASFANQRQTV